MRLRKVLIKYWVTYISITLFTIMAMAPIYLQVHNNVRTQQMRDTDMLLQSKFSLFLAEYTQMQSIVLRLQGDRDYVLLSRWSGNDERTNVYRYIRFQETLQEATTPSLLILDAYALFDGSRFVVSKRNPAMEREDFYARELSYPNLSFDQWQDVLWEQQVPHLPIEPLRYFQTLQTRAATFLFRTGVTGRPSGVIAIVVDEVKLSGFLMLEDIRTDGYLRLTGPDGVILYEYAARDIEEGDGLNLFAHTDPATGLQLQAGVHERVYAETTRAVRNTLALYIGIALAVSLLLSGAYTVYVYRPVRASYEQMRREGLDPAAEKSLYKVMSVSISGLLTNKRDLERELAKINRKHREQIITNIVYGMAVPSREIETALLPMAMFHAPYLVVRLTLLPEREAPIADVGEVYSHLTDTLSAVFQADFFPLMGSRGALISLGSFGEDAVIGRMEAISASIRNSHACIPVFAVSRALEGTGMLRDGWAEATQLIRFAGAVESAILRMDQVNALFSQYDLVVFQPEILLAQLAQADERALSAYCDMLMGQLTALHFDRPHRAEQLYLNITETCQMALRKNGLPEASLPPYSTSQDILGTAEALRGAMLQINGRIREGRTDSSPKRDSVIEYIREHFTDPDLSLTGLAGIFHYSEGYISQIVKKQTGLNYADFVNALRMERASDLLMDDALTATDVAAQSGFHNINTFYKAFKKKYGMAPKTYRDQMRRPEE